MSTTTTTGSSTPTHRATPYPERPPEGRGHSASLGLQESRYLESLPREHGFEPLAVEGVLPDDLRGTLYRNGPALSERFGIRFSHIFEGDGGLTAVRFEDGQAQGASRLIRTKLFMEEERARRQLFGMSVSWPRRVLNVFRGKMKNPTNVNVMLWQDRLFALPEMAPPVELDRDTLLTIGEMEDLEVGMHCAHPHTNVKRGATYSYSFDFGRSSALRLFEFPFVGQPRELGRVPLPYASYNHDFIVTDTHMIFFLCPVEVSIRRAVMQIGGMQDLVKWAPDHGTEIVVVPIDNPKEIVRFRTDPFYQWHFSNAFTGADGLINVDYVRYEDFSTMDNLGFEESDVPPAPGFFSRATIDLKRRRFSSRPLSPVDCEFPRMHPGRVGSDYRYAWVSGSSEGEQTRGHISRIDIETEETRTFFFEDGQQPSEPVFVPRVGATREDEGYLVSVVYDPTEHRSFAAVLDAQNVEKGVMGKAWFDHHVPITFHGDWLGA